MLDVDISYLWNYVLFFFFKQKTAYEMRISDWSSDVCSSDLPGVRFQAISWWPDSHRLGDPRLRDPDSGRADTALYAGQQVYAHVIGTDWRTDPVVFGRAMPSSADIPESDFPEVDIQADAGLAFGRHSAGVAQEFGLYVAPLES